MISVAVDLGGSRIKLGLVAGNELLFIKILPAAPDRGLANALTMVGGEIQALDEIHVSTAEVSGIGISFPGLVDSRANRILSAPAGKYFDAPGIDIAAWGRDSFSLPVVVENDANMAMLGEWKYGAGKDCNNLVMVTLGTGIGTSVIIDGVPLRGAHFQAGCLGGHFTLEADGRSCICGNIGCIEMSASTSVLSDMIRSEAGTVISYLHKEKHPDYQTVFAYAAAGDELAGRILLRSIKTWGIVLVNLIHAYDPEKIIGGIMNADADIISRLQEYADRHAWTPWGKVTIVKAQRPDAAALFGVQYKLLTQQ
jgi:glucokinase